MTDKSELIKRVTDATAIPVNKEIEQKIIEQIEVDKIVARNYLLEEIEKRKYNPKLLNSWNQIIFNCNTTIFNKFNGEKYICTCDNEDKFDKEKGVMLCLLKSYGYSYSDVRKLVDNAKDTSNKVTKKQKKELKKFKQSQVDDGTKRKEDL